MNAIETFKIKIGAPTNSEQVYLEGDGILCGEHLVAQSFKRLPCVGAKCSYSRDFLHVACLPINHNLVTERHKHFRHELNG